MSDARRSEPTRFGSQRVDRSRRGGEASVSTPAVWNMTAALESGRSDIVDRLRAIDDHRAGRPGTVSEPWSTLVGGAAPFADDPISPRSPLEASAWGRSVRWRVVTLPTVAPKRSAGIPGFGNRRGSRVTVDGSPSRMPGDHDPIAQGLALLADRLAWLQRGRDVGSEHRNACRVNAWQGSRHRVNALRRRVAARRRGPDRYSFGVSDAQPMPEPLVVGGDRRRDRR